MALDVYVHACQSFRPSSQAPTEEESEETLSAVHCMFRCILNGCAFFPIQAPTEEEIEENLAGNLWWVLS